MNCKPFMRAAIEAIGFFALCDEDDLAPDTAVSQLEHLGSILKQLDDDDRKEFREFVDEVAREEESHSGKNERVAFLYSLCENLGLTE